MSKYSLFKNCRLIDGCGNDPKDNAVIVIKDDVIEAIGETDIIKNYPDAEVINIQNKTFMPGLIDAHVHLWGVNNMDPNWILEPSELRAIRSVMDAWKILDCGYTTVRDCGNPNSLQLKRAIEEGKAIGPRIMACGSIITQTGGHGDLAHSIPQEWSIERGIARIADGADECRKAVREQLREGADFIKICTTGGVHSQRDLPTSSQFTVDEIKAMAEEAHNVGLKLASHAQGEKGILNAIYGGVDTIEHGFYMTDEIIEMMLQKNIYYIPTLSAMEVMARVDPSITGLPETSFKKAQVAYEEHLKSFKKACEAGVKIGCGTDWEGANTTPFDGISIELELQVREGRSPMDVIHSATEINAEALGIGGKTGTIEVGKYADFIIVEGDPSKDIKVLRHKNNIVKIYKEGKLCPRLPF